jgi:hypothetical protein
LGSRRLRSLVASIVNNSPQTGQRCAAVGADVRLGGDAAVELAFVDDVMFVDVVRGGQSLAPHSQFVCATCYTTKWSKVLRV